MKGKLKSSFLILGAMLIIAVFALAIEMTVNAATTKEEKDSLSQSSNNLVSENTAALTNTKEVKTRRKSEQSRRSDKIK